MPPGYTEHLLIAGVLFVAFTDLVIIAAMVILNRRDTGSVLSGAPIPQPH